ncbi:hypothetical protein ACMD2_17956, partial [Ananas comosus]
LFLRRRPFLQAILLHPRRADPLPIRIAMGKNRSLLPRDPLPWISRSPHSHRSPLFLLRSQRGSRSTSSGGRRRRSSSPKAKGGAAGGIQEEKVPAARSQAQKDSRHPTPPHQTPGVFEDGTREEEGEVFSHEEVCNQSMKRVGVFDVLSWNSTLLVISVAFYCNICSVG